MRRRRARPAPVRRADLDLVGGAWRRAFGSAEDALRDAASGTSRLGAAELRVRRRRLADERAAVAGLLDAVAREERVRLRRPLSAPRPTRRMLGLPPAARACVFDLDGVLTESAELHAAAWAETFDAFLARRERNAAPGLAHLVRPFDPAADYRAHLHGRPRLDGVRTFLRARGIRLPEGAPGDPPGAETVYGLAARKDEALRRRLAREGVAAYGGSRGYVEAALEAGLRIAVVSASAHTGEILERAGLAALLGERVDGETIRRGRLRAKPAPDTILAACRLLEMPPERAVAFETTPAGVVAARAAGVGLVLAVDRAGRAAELRRAGADAVVSDLGRLLPSGPA